MRYNYKDYLNSDYYRYTGKHGGVVKCLLRGFFTTDDGYRYLVWLRLSQHPNILKPIAILMHFILGHLYHIDIPRCTKIGFGLYLGHGMCMVVNGDTVIGNNVNLSQFLNIGSNHRLHSVIGDNVYIGPHVCIVENVTIGNNVTIGAGAVVTRDIPDNATAVGVPARVINNNNPGIFVKNQYSIND